MFEVVHHHGGALTGQRGDYPVQAVLVQSIRKDGIRKGHGGSQRAQQKTVRPDERHDVFRIKFVCRV